MRDVSRQELLTMAQTISMTVGHLIYAKNF